MLAIMARRPRLTAPAPHVRPIIFPITQSFTRQPGDLRPETNKNDGGGAIGTVKVWQLGCMVGALAAIPLAAVHHMEVSRPSVATPNAVVADAFSAMELTMILANLRAAFPAAPVAAKLDAALSANAIVAAEFGSIPDVDELKGSEPEGRILPPDVSLDAARPSEVALQQVATAAPAELIEPELPHLKDDAYSETVRPDNPAKIALAALSDVPLGTPVEEIDRAAEAFGLDAKFMKAVAKIESDFNPRERTGSYVGLFQLSKSEFRKYGSGDILNPRDNAMAAASKLIAEATLFEELTHKKLTFADLYLIHQQGWEGAFEHVSNPEQIAWKSMCATQEGMAKGERWCKRAIWGNTLPSVKREWRSVDRLTSGAFVAMWRDRIETLLARYAEPTPRRPEA